MVNKNKSSKFKIIILILLLASLLAGIFFVFEKDFSFVNPGPGVLQPGDPSTPGDNEQPGDNEDPDDNKEPGDNDNKDPDENKKQNLNSYWLVAQTFTYDGEVKSLKFNKQLPADVIVAPFNNEHVEVGVHSVRAELSGENYNTHTTTATLTINPAVEPPAQNKNFTGLKFESKDFVYDGTEKSLKVAGVLPEGTIIKYSDNNSQTEIGTYSVRATITLEGYNTLVMTASLRILPQNFEGLSLESKTAEYNGYDHFLSLDGFWGIRQYNPIIDWSYKTTGSGQMIVNEPLNSSIRAKEPGVYNIKVVINAENFNSKTLNATLTITEASKKDIEGVAFNSQDFEYDGEIKSLVIEIEEGYELPEGAVVDYSENNSQTEVGSYSVNATITADGYNTLKLNAIMRIIKSAPDSDNTYLVEVFALNLENRFERIYFTTAIKDNTILLDNSVLLSNINRMLHKHNPYLTASLLTLHNTTELNSQISNDLVVVEDTLIYVDYVITSGEPSIYHSVIFKPVITKDFSENIFVLGEGQTLIGYENLESLLINAISHELGFDVQNLIFYNDESGNSIFNLNKKIESETTIFVDYHTDSPSVFDYIPGDIAIRVYQENGFKDIEWTGDLSDVPIPELSEKTKLIKNKYTFISPFQIKEYYTVLDLLQRHINALNSQLYDLWEGYTHLSVFNDKVLLTDIYEYVNENSEAYYIHSNPDFLLDNKSEITHKISLYDNFINIYNEDTNGHRLRYYLPVLLPYYDTSNLIFEEQTFIYDGTPKFLEVIGDLPNEAVISYYNNYQIEIGTYYVSALIQVPGFRDTWIQTLLHIVNGDESGGTTEQGYDLELNPYNINFKSAEYEYDGEVKAIFVSGDLTADTNISYVNNYQSDVGKYEVLAYIKIPGYHEFSYTANLLIYELDYFNKETLTDLIELFEGSNNYINNVITQLETIRTNMESEEITLQDSLTLVENLYDEQSDLSQSGFNGLVDLAISIRDRVANESYGWVYKDGFKYYKAPVDLYSLLNSLDLLIQINPNTFSASMSFQISIANANNLKDFNLEYLNYYSSVLHELNTR